MKKTKKIIKVDDIKFINDTVLVDYDTITVNKDLKDNSDGKKLLHSDDIIFWF